MRTSLKTLTVSALTATAVLAAPAAFAADTVTQAVNGNGMNAFVTNAALAPVFVSHAVSHGTGTLSLTADDLTGTAAGWNVTEQLTGAFVGSNGGSIEAVNFSVTPGAVTTNSGAAAGVTASATGGTLDNPVKVLSAAVGSGMGNYTLAIDADLAVPADSLAGTYTGTLTTTMTAAP